LPDLPEHSLIKRRYAVISILEFTFGQIERGLRSPENDGLPRIPMKNSIYRGGVMSSARNCDEEKPLYIHRTAIFDRNLENLHSKSGSGSLAAGKAEEVIRNISCEKRRGARLQFRFTRKGEYRIKNCMKYDLGCGYRLVFIRENSHVIFLYVGSHDDCCRWIDRNKGRIHTIADTPHAMRAICSDSDGTSNCVEEFEEDEYEARLMNRIDDKILRRIFSAFEEG
jgi:hypothetical protein